MIKSQKVMEVKIENQPKATYKVTIKIPSDKVKEVYRHVLEEVGQNTEIAGFRKGKAPLELVEKNAKESELNGETVNHLLQEYYVQALKENKLATIGNPKVTVKKFGKDTEFEFEALVAKRPEVKIGDYRKAIKDLFQKNKEEKKEAFKGIEVEEIIKVLSDLAEVEYSDLLVDDEITRMLSRLLQQSETLGLTIEQYLQAQNKTAEDLRKEYEGYAHKSLKTEFALSKALELEGIKVEDNEIEEAINAVPDAKIRENLQKGQDRWYIISVLAKNKLINKLLGELEEK